MGIVNVKLKTIKQIKSSFEIIFFIILLCIQNQILFNKSMFRLAKKIKICYNFFNLKRGIFMKKEKALIIIKPGFIKYEKPIFAMLEKLANVKVSGRKKMRLDEESL